MTMRTDNDDDDLNGDVVGEGRDHHGSFDIDAHVDDVTDNNFDRDVLDDHDGDDDDEADSDDDDSDRDISHDDDVSKLKHKLSVTFNIICRGVVVGAFERNRRRAHPTCDE